MEGSVAYLFAIVFFILALNLYFMFSRMRRGNRRKKMDRIAVDEAKQAIWRDKEIARRIEREQDDAYERVKLRNETLALYEEVRRRHENDNWESLKDSYISDEKNDDPEINIFESLDLYLNDDEPEKVDLLSFTSNDEPENDNRDPFDIFKRKK